MLSVSFIVCGGISWSTGDRFQLLPLSFIRHLDRQERLFLNLTRSHQTAQLWSHSHSYYQQQLALNTFPARVRLTMAVCVKLSGTSPARWRVKGMTPTKVDMKWLPRGSEISGSVKKTYAPSLKRRKPENTREKVWTKRPHELMIGRTEWMKQSSAPKRSVWWRTASSSDMIRFSIEKRVRLKVNKQEP